MAKGKDLEFQLPSVDDLFSSNEIREDDKRQKIIDISISEIDNFDNHPFKVKEDESMLELVESIKENGVLTPAVLRQKDDGRYELVSGHRRKRACELAGIETLPSIIKTLSKDEAIIYMVDSNLQREEILPSEKAFSYKMRLDAMKRQAGRPVKDNYSPLGNNLKGVNSSAILSDAVGESKNQIFRYIRLTELLPEILDKVDEGSMGLRPAVELSYLKKEEQSWVYNSMESEECTPTFVQAAKMRKLSNESRLNENVIYSIMQEDKPNQKEKIVLKDDRFNRYFPNHYSTKQKEDLLATLLEKWYKQREKER